MYVCFSSPWFIRWMTSKCRWKMWCGPSKLLKLCFDVNFCNAMLPRGRLTPFRTQFGLAKLLPALIARIIDLNRGVSIWCGGISSPLLCCIVIFEWELGLKWLTNCESGQFYGLNYEFKHFRMFEISKCYHIIPIRC